MESQARGGIYQLCSFHGIAVFIFEIATLMKLSFLIFLISPHFPLCLFPSNE